MKVNHGANLYDLSSQYGFSKEDFMDFSSIVKLKSYIKKESVD